MPTEPRKILALLDAGAVSACVGAALELGLFWILADHPQSVDAVASRLGIPHVRCSYWLQVLAQAGLIDEGPDGFRPSSTARTGILDAYSRETWAFLAQEERERLSALVDLARSLGDGGTKDALHRAGRPDYVSLMAADADRARRFTRMLYELHRPLADALLHRVDLNGVAQLLDLGGGSGVVSLTFARRYPALRATVVDLATVCEAGRALAAENELEDRVTYHAADFLREMLPTGFDLALMCDVGICDRAVYERIGAALNRPGRLVVVDVLAPAKGIAPGSRAIWALERSLVDPLYAPPTEDNARSLLTAAGFSVRGSDKLRLSDDSDPFTIVEADVV